MMRSWICSVTQGCTGIGVPMPMLSGWMHPDESRGTRKAPANSTIRLSLRMTTLHAGERDAEQRDAVNGPLGNLYRTANWADFKGCDEKAGRDGTWLGGGPA